MWPWPKLQQHFRAVLTGEEDPEEAPLGKLVSLAGVRQYPAASNAPCWAGTALMHAIAGNQEAANTEDGIPATEGGVA